MDWWNYAIGVFTGCCTGFSIGVWKQTKTINIYRGIVADYEQMVMHMLCQQLGIPPEDMDKAITAMTEDRKRGVQGGTKGVPHRADPARGTAEGS